MLAHGPDGMLGHSVSILRARWYRREGAARRTKGVGADVSETGDAGCRFAELGSGQVSCAKTAPDDVVGRTRLNPEGANVADVDR